MIADGLVVSASNDTVARLPGRSTTTLETPGTCSAAGRTCFSQLPHVMPVTVKDLVTVAMFGFGVLVPSSWFLGPGSCYAVRSRRLFETTLTELNAMAALARIGLSISPKIG